MTGNINAVYTFSKDAFALIDESGIQVGIQNPHNIFGQVSHLISSWIMKQSISMLIITKTNLYQRKNGRWKDLSLQRSAGVL